MPHSRQPDAESLRMVLQEAITTFRHQIGILIQALGVIVTADSVLLAYGFSKRQSGVLLIASLMPIAALGVFFAVMDGLLPVSYVAIKVERRLSLEEASLMTSWAGRRDDLPFSSLGNVGDWSDSKVEEIVAKKFPWYLMKSLKTYILLTAFIAQLTVALLSATIFHYRFM